MERKIRSSERGSAMMIAITVTVVCAGIAMGLTLATFSRSQSSTITSDYADLQKLCDAGLTKARRVVWKNWSSINAILNACYNYNTTNIQTIADRYQKAYNAGAFNTYLGINSYPTYTQGSYTTTTYTYTSSGNTTSYASTGGGYMSTAEGSYSLGENMFFHDAGVHIYIANGPQDASPTVNTDNKVTIWITATKMSGTKNDIVQKQIKAVCEYVPPPSTGYTARAALLAGDSVTLSGNAAVAGTAGVVQANGNITLSGNAVITQGGYATGSVTNDGGPSQLYSNQSTFSIPPISPYTAASNIAGNGSYSGITYWVTAAGNVYRPNGSPTTSPAVSTSGWTLLGSTSSSGQWYSGLGSGNNFNVASNNTIPNGAYFFETTDVNGSAHFSGNASGQSVSFFTNGSLFMSGNATASIPYLSNTMAVCSGNITVTGNGNLGNNTVAGTALFFAGGSLAVSGNGQVYGSVTARGTTIVDSLNGNAILTYNGPVTTNLITVVTYPTSSLLVRMYQQVK